MRRREGGEGRKRERQNRNQETQTKLERGNNKRGRRRVSERGKVRKETEMTERETEGRRVSVCGYTYVEG